ncbi:MAG: ATP-dependent zinc protease, partial [Deltaproteobacteria bacterium]|nr:ATP-dependent zinc protease [Deltaproteobacteria bacterium]
FKIHPRQRKKVPTVKAHAELIGIRKIKSSTGHITLRPVVTTQLQIGEDIYLIELNLFNRDMMGFRMLLGRQAIRHKYVVHPHHSYLTGNKPVKKS